MKLMQLSTQVDGDRGVIRVSGEVDDVNAPTLGRAATKMLSDGVHNRDRLPRHRVH